MNSSLSRLNAAASEGKPSPYTDALNVTRVIGGASKVARRLSLTSPGVGVGRGLRRRFRSVALASARCGYRQGREGGSPTRGRDRINPASTKG